MDSFFSLKGKEALLISGFLGVFIYFFFLDGEANQNKYYYIALGYGVWIIFKNIYWFYRTKNIVNTSKQDILKCFDELEKIRKIDGERAAKIENLIF